MNREKIIQKCEILLQAYKKDKLGYMKMPEDEKPDSFTSQEEKLVYFTLPMALNYQRNSYTLWESVLETYKNNPPLFGLEYSVKLSEEGLRKDLLEFKIALQSNKHIQTWMKIAGTVYQNWGTLEKMLESTNHDFLKLKQLVQKDYKKGFPYLSGPKIFNYWSYILTQYCDITFTNMEYIEIAPDTHVKQCSIRLGVITEDEAEIITTEGISRKWRKILEGTGITPIEMHSPLWFWSRNNFEFKVNIDIIK